MARKAKMATLWEVSDALWDRILPVLNEADTPQVTGRPRADRRLALDGIIFQLRTGCPWNRIPRAFGDDSTIHRYFRSWTKRGVFARIWGILVEECGELDASVIDPATPPTADGSAWSRVPGSPQPQAPRKRTAPPTFASVGS